MTIVSFLICINIIIIQLSNQLFKDIIELYFCIVSFLPLASAGIYFIFFLLPLSPLSPVHMQWPVNFFGIGSSL